jgi:hypothetical protein
MIFLKKSMKIGIVAVLVLGLLGLSGCATYTFLQSKVVDPSNILASSIADKKFNVVRFVSFGPHMDQIYGYVLYDDDVDVRTKSAPLAKLGKMSLKETLQDYDNTRLANNWYRASSPVIREVNRSGKLVALTASDNMLESNLWEDTEASVKANKTVLILSYRDLRRLDRDGGGGVPEMSR